MNSRRTVAMSTAVVMGGLVGTLSYATPAAADCANTAVAPTAAVLVLLDRSGSMADDGICKGDTTPSRKWGCAIKDASSFISGNGSISFPANTSFFVWQFRLLDSNPDPTMITEPYNGSGAQGMCVAEANTLITTDPRFGGPLSHDANTPLATAYCKAVKFLMDFKTTAGVEFPLYIKVESDGVDNLPTLVDPLGCAGPSGGYANYTPTKPVTGFLPDAVNPTTVDGLVVHSWEANMYDASITGSAHTSTPIDTNVAFKYKKVGLQNVPVISSFSFIEDFIPTPVASLLASPVAVAASYTSSLFANVGVFAGLAQTASTPTANDGLAKFYEGLAQTGGGRMIRFGSGAPIASGAVGSYHVLRGDANDNGCVNSADYNLVKSSYGKNATAANADAIRADLNEDGIVNSVDYLVLKAQWGRGCTTTPPAIPSLSNTLFAFEDVSNWSSTQASLALTSAKRTEGNASLKVAGSGYREIKSVKFTTPLTGATSTLAMDVLRPTTSPNPPAYATVQLFVSVPSAGVNETAIGNAIDIRTFDANTFKTVVFTVPSNVKSALTTAHSDATVKVVLNAANAGYQFDNLRFQ